MRMIVLLEENTDIAAALSGALASEGYRVLGARSASEAIALLAEHGESVRSVVIDAGFGTSQPEIFRDHQLRTEGIRDIPVIVMSAGLRPEEEAARLGSTSVLRMPFDLDVLLDRLAEVPSRPVAAAEKPRILVVDDDDLDRACVMQLLDARGFESVGVADGGAAFRLLEEMDPKPAAIVLDLMLPGMPGRTFLARQLEDEDLARIPVIVVTAQADAHDDDSLADVDVMIKPIDAGDFGRRLTTLVGV